MSSPSAGKRRMDTDVIKLYPLCGIVIIRSQNNLDVDHQLIQVSWLMTERF